MTQAKQGAPMRGKTFRFNPMLHQSSVPRRVDFGVSTPHSNPWYRGMANYLDELDAPTSYSSEEYLKGLRLGRIVQHERAAGMAATNKFRYGFRFLYNPTNVQISASRNNTMIADPQNEIAAVVSGINQNFQVISFPLLLNRIPDLQINAYGNRYPIALTPEDVAGIEKYGTHWDLEYLYRVCNGIFNLDDRGRTADIGMLQPSNARLIMGPGRDYFGFVEGVSYKDILFTDMMIPTLTEVQIMFRRHVDMTPDDSKDFSDLLGIVGSTSGTTAKSGPSIDITGEGGAGSITDLLKLFGGIFDNFGPLSDEIKKALETNISYLPANPAPPPTGTPPPSDSGSTTPPSPTAPPAVTGPQVGNNFNAPAPIGTTVYNNGYKNVLPGVDYSAGYHTGHDYSGHAKFTDPALATRGGTVIFAGRGGSPGWGSAYGNHVVIHTDVPGTRGIRHLYAHLHTLNVKTGQSVKEGDRIGIIGNSGTRQEGKEGVQYIIHLHYEERVSPWGYNNHRQPIWGTWKGKWV